MHNRPSIGTLTVAIALATLISGCAPPPAVKGEGYQLVFADDFETLNTSVWSNKHPWQVEPPAGAITVADGTLTLRSSKANGYPSPNLTSLGTRTGSDYPHYPDATTFEEGYFEARMRFTDSAHSRPAFWLLGVEWAQRWPDPACPTLQGEIDIVEPLMLPTDEFHFAQHRNTSSPCGVPRQGRGIKRQVGFELSDWHTYAARWADGELCSYVDDVEMGCLPAFDAIEQPMYIVLSQEGECSPWREELCREPKPQEMVTEVDWVRVWQVTS